MMNRRKDDKKLTLEQKGWADICTAGGGTYRGTFGSVAECGYTLVLFDSPATGSTLAIKSDALTPDAVRAHIAESNAKFGVK